MLPANATLVSYATPSILSHFPFFEAYLTHHISPVNISMLAWNVKNFNLFALLPLNKNQQ
jgi:hypothetical protein